MNVSTLSEQDVINVSFLNLGNGRPLRGITWPDFKQFLIDNLSTSGVAVITGTVEGDNGSSATPTYTFTSDQDTGIYRIGANNVGVSLGGTKYVDFAANLAAFTGAITASTSFTAGTTVTVGTILDAGAGTVSLPSYTFTGDLDTGLYHIGANNIGIAVSGSKIVDLGASAVTITPATTITGALTATGGVVTGAITEKTAGAGITISKNLVRKTTLTALDSTGTLTAAMVNKGGITSTSGSPVTATLDTVANLVTQLGAVAGTFVDFVVDNTGGSNTVTVAVPSGMVAAKQTSSGDTAADILLTVAASATLGVGVFRIYFQSTSAAILYRLG